MRLTTKTLLDVTLYAAKMEQTSHTMEALAYLSELRERVKVFEAVVWFPRLQRQVTETTSRGMRGSCRGVSIMTWCCAGRCLIQLQWASKPLSSLTLITADDEKPWQRIDAHVAPHMGPMGIQAIDAEYLDALTMLYTVTRYADEIELQPDPTVTLG